MNMEVKLFMLQFFQYCKTKQEAKAEFRRLAKIYHPDTETGSNETMVQIINQYEQVMKRLEYAKDTENQRSNETDEQFKARLSKEMQEVLVNVSHLPIEIEVIGSWIWVSGNTYPYRSYLTANNFNWCPKKRMFSWTLTRRKKYKAEPQDMEKIRERYGSQRVNGSERVALA